MVAGEAHEPGSRCRRYDALSGDPSRRLTYYLARRFLNIGPAEWDRLPWWEQAIYQEGLQNEAPWIGRSVMLNKADDPLDVRKGLFGNPYEDDDEGSAEDLASFGIRVNQSATVTPVYRSAADG